MLAVDDHLAIERLYSAYNQYIDKNRFDEWVALFAADGVLITSETFTGHTELANFIRQRAEQQNALPFRDAQHWNANLLLDMEGDVVRGSCYLVRFAVDRASGAREVVSLGSYQDKLVKVDGSWLFARRQAFPL